MAFGLRIRDAGGNITLDTSDRFGRLIWSGVVAVTPNWQFVPITGMSDDGTWIVMPINAVDVNTRVNLTVVHEIQSGGFRIYDYLIANLGISSRDYDIAVWRY